MGKPKDVDAYITEAPKEVQSKLREIRKAIREAAPDAIESISYQMPYYAKREIFHGAKEASYGSDCREDTSVCIFLLQS